MLRCQVNSGIELRAFKQSYVGLESRNDGAQRLAQELMIIRE